MRRFFAITTNVTAMLCIDINDTDVQTLYNKTRLILPQGVSSLSLTVVYTNGEKGSDIYILIDKKYHEILDGVELCSFRTAMGSLANFGTKDILTSHATPERCISNTSVFPKVAELHLLRGFRLKRQE